jgi:hypothetical protein
LPDGSRPPVWFAFDDSRPLAFFAGIWTRWTTVRKVREGETTNDLFGFLPFELPRLPHESRWRVFANTGMPSPEDAFDPGSEPELADQAGCIVGGRSVVILVGRPAAQ